MSYIDQITVGSTTYDIKDANAVTSVNGATGSVLLAIPSDTSDLTNGAGYITGMYVASYGSSTYADVLAAYQANKVVYCRASSNSNPGTGSQNRMAFLAYVNNSTTPTEFEFQYYRSVSTHSDAQQGDQVFIYKLNSSGTWSVTTREAYTKIATGTGLSKSYANGTLTIANTVTTPEAATATPLVAGTAAVGTATKYAREDHVHPEQTTINGHTVASDVPANAVFTDTTYESKTAVSGGTDVSLVTTGEKYTWNNMLPTVSSSDNNKVLTVVNGTWAAASASGGNIEVMTSEEIWAAAASGWGSTNPSVAAAVWNSVAAGWSVSATMTDSTIRTAVDSGWR